MKKTLSLVLALVMVLGSFSAAFAAESVTTGAEAGAFLKAAGVLVGDENGNLNLGDNLSRQDAVILVAQLRGEIKAAQAFEGTATYEDVEIKFYNAPLAWAQENGLFVGHSEKVFGFNEDLTAQEYAKVLLTALGYKVAPNGDSDIKWAEALTKAKDFGILTNLDVENATEITRGEMALMTFNALGVTMKDSKKTLADTLGIEMPAPDVLTAEVNDTENLKEVVVELSNAKLADAEKLANKDNYRVDKLKVAKVTVEDNKVTLLLEKELVKNRSYDLVIRNVDKAINKTYSFKAYDNASPKVEKVEALGEYGIKVTVSEPVTNVRERNFLVDGKNVAMNIEEFGRVIILTPYHKAAFASNAEKLTIKELEDYSGYKSALEDFEIEVVKDTVAPVVVEAIVKGSVVEVTFDKDVYADSVTGYVSKKDEGNISYRSGRQDIFTKEEAEVVNEEGKKVTVNYGKKIDTNVVRYTFDDNLPRRTDVVIEGVQNHSKVTMDRVTVEAREVKDDLEPEIIDVDITRNIIGKAGEATSKVTLELEFDKDIASKSFTSDNKDSKDKDLNFTLYTEKVLSRYEAEDKVVSVDYKQKDGKDVKNVIVVVMEELTLNNKAKEFDYILEIKNFESESGSRMIRDYYEFEVKDDKKFAVESVKVDHNEKRDETEIVLGFTQPVDRTRAEDETNYVFFKRSATTGQITSRKDVADFDGEVIVERDGYTVTLRVPKFKDKGWNELEILSALRDKDGNKLAGSTFIDLLKGEAIVDVTTNDTAAVSYAGKVDGVDKYIVRPTATNVTINSVASVIIEVIGDVEGTLTIDAANAHVIVNGEVVTVKVEDIGASSLEIKGKVTNLVVNTPKMFKVYGNVKGLEIETGVGITARVKIAETKVKADEIADANATVITPGTKLVVTIDGEGNVDTGVVATAAKELDKVLDAVVTTDGAIELEVTTDGAIKLDVEAAVKEKVANVKLTAGYEATVKVKYNEVKNDAIVTFTVTETENVKNTAEEMGNYNIKVVTPMTPLTPAGK